MLAPICRKQLAPLCRKVTPVSGDQVSVRTSQGALPGLGKKHQPVARDVCAVEFVDGA